MTKMPTIRRLAAAFAACALLAVLFGCSEQDQPAALAPEGNCDGDNGMGYRLELKIGFDGMGDSRSDPEPQTPTLPTTQGNKFENTINTLSLFVYNSSLELVDSVTLDPSAYLALPFTARSEENWLYLVHNIEDIQHGDYTVYVAANLSPEQRVEFTAEIESHENPDVFYTMSGNHLHIAAHLTSKAYGMAMSCTDPDSFEFTPSKTGGLCVFHLKRIVAKALVTAKTENEYVVVNTTDENAKQKFMIRLADVSFTVNSVNTCTYLYQHQYGATPYTEKPYVLDPNKDFTAAAEEQFVYNPISSWSNFTAYFNKVKPHDLSKYPYNTYPQDNVYDESIFYFPENTFDVTLPDGLEAEKQATHLIIRAKIIPLSLKVKKGLKQYAQDNGVGGELYNLIAAAEDAAPASSEIYTIHCTSEEFSKYICELSLNYESFPGVSNSTFFVKVGDTNKDLYTYSAAKYEVQGTEYVQGVGNTTELEGFEVYNNGYANYKVFLEDPRTGLEADAAKPWNRSQIFRNTYYIVCIDEFVSPGQGLDPEEEYIKVHTMAVPYINSWNGNINITDET